MKEWIILDEPLWCQ